MMSSHLPVLATSVLLAAFAAPASPPPPPPPPPTRAIRLIVQLDPQPVGQSKATIVAMTDVTIPLVHRYRRVGDYVYAVVQGASVVESAVLPGDPFERRTAGTATPHTAPVPQTRARVVVIIPNAQRSDIALPPWNTGVKFYKLGPLEGDATGGVRQGISPARILDFLAVNRAVFAEISPTDIKYANGTLPH